MKLDAAALLETDRPFRITLIVSLSLVLLASASSALDGIDISAEAAAMKEAGEPTKTADGECPRLIQIKYPFLRCSHGEIGLSDSDADWANSRQIPLQTKFVEGDGYFGPSLNQSKD
jgi:hypothetical protein